MRRILSAVGEYYKYKEKYPKVFEILDVWYSTLSSIEPDIYDIDYLDVEERDLKTFNLWLLETNYFMIDDRDDSVEVPPEIELLASKLDEELIRDVENHKNQLENFHKDDDGYDARRDQQYGF